MSHTLSIETSADACNVSLIGPDRIVTREADEPRSHARVLVPLIQQLLQAEGARPDAICVDCGPGSYTGLRIGVSSAKGLAWSMGLPLMAIPSLALMAAGLCDEVESDPVPVRCMIPARGQEVFTARYSVAADAVSLLSGPEVLRLDHLIPSLGSDLALVSVSTLGDRIESADTRVLPPHSRNAAPFVRNPGDVYRVEDVSSLEPLYLREFEAKKPAVSIFDRLPF